MGERENIFLVDDNEDLRNSTQTLLDIMGHNVVETADSIEDVIIKLQSDKLKFRVAIVDGQMPNKGDGEIAAKLIKDKYSSTVIISYSADSQSWGNYNVSKRDGIDKLLETISKV